MIEQLTPNVCVRLNDPDEYHVLFASPVLQVVAFAPAAVDEVHGFALERAAVLTDGVSEAQVLLPVGLRLFGCGETFTAARALQEIQDLLDDPLRLAL